MHRQQTTDLKLGTDAGGLLLLVRVEESLGGAVVEGETHDVLEGLGVH